MDYTVITLLGKQLFFQTKKIALFFFNNCFLSELSILEPPSPEVCYVNDVRGHRVSEHGCCWDGIIPATGPGGQGCPGRKCYVFLNMCQHNFATFSKSR